jgi:polygalacturonase
LLAALLCALPVSSWSVCDVSKLPYGAIGDGVTKDTNAIRSALAECDEVWLPADRSFLSGPLNLTSNQVLRVDGTLLASIDRHDYALIAPLMGYGWGDDENCFAPDRDKHKIIIGTLRYTPVIGAYHASNVTLTGNGIIDGQGQTWWENCTKCHYTPGNDSSYCEIASRPKLIETQYVDGFNVIGSHTLPPQQASETQDAPTPTPTFLPPTPTPPVWPGTLTLQNSPFWTLTPSYTQNIHVSDLRILAPIDRIGNTDGVNLDSCRNALVENVWIQNSDDGVCIKSGLNGFGLNLGIPTENVLVRNITCPKGGRGGFAIGSEMSGGMRNITFRDSVLHGERGIDIKPSVGRGGYIQDLTFENIAGNGVHFGMGGDGDPLMSGNHYVPLIANMHFINIASAVGNSFDGCHKANRSKCFNLTVDGKADHWPDPLPPQTFACKRTAKTMFGTVALPWPVCLPLDAPVNLRPDYPNYGPATGNYSSLAECKAACQ